MTFLITADMRKSIVDDPNSPPSMLPGLDMLEQLMRDMQDGDPLAACMHTEAFIEDKVLVNAVICAAVGLLTASERRLQEAQGTFDGLDEATKDRLIDQVAARHGVDPETVRGQLK